MNLLTFDKPPLSGPKNDVADEPESRAINCTQQYYAAHSEQIDDFVRDSLSENTRRAYASDIARFETWGGKLPASPEMIAAYLSENASSHAVTTLVRWLASLTKAHKAILAQDPTKAELVRSVLRGIRRRHGRPPEQAAPLTRETLFELLDAIPDDLRGKRDRALLLIGFAGGFRRSELVALQVADVMTEAEGITLVIRRSKTDQTAQGRKMGIPYARGRHCPVKALAAWMLAASVTVGPVFRSIDRHGVISISQLSGQAVSLMVKERLLGAHLDPSGFSGHSLRAGFVTSAAKAGVSSWKIRQQTGHASDTMLARYIRDTEIFVDNPAGALF